MNLVTTAKGQIGIDHAAAGEAKPLHRSLRHGQPA